MAFTTPSTRTAEVISVDDWNTDVVANFTAIGGAWATYTPAITASSSNPTLTLVAEGRYRLIGKTCDVVIDIKITTMTNAGSGDWIISLPSAADPMVPGSTLVPCLGGYVYDQSGGGTRFTVFAERTGTSLVKLGRDGTAGFVTHAAPIPWANADEIHLRGTYEIS